MAMNYSQLQIFYFSGTGNAKNVAHWLSEAANRHHIETLTTSISATNKTSIIKPLPESLIVFISPIHGFNYPPIVLHFLRHFPKGKNNVILMNTRAGMLIGKFITPGVSGIAFYLASLILISKGYTIKGMRPVDMPSNWISVHPGLNTKTIQYLHNKNKARVEAFAEQILKGKSSFKALREIVIDLSISPISILYYFIGRFVIAKTFYASINCNNCGLCIKSCPTKAIKMISNKPFWTLKCESCMHCMSYCPANAIETSHGFTLLFFILTSTIAVPFIYLTLSSLSISIHNEFIKFIFESLISIALIVIWYRLVHLAMKLPIIAKLNKLTSLTNYKFWGKRYKSLKP